MDILKRFEAIIGESKNPMMMEFGMCDGYHSNIMLDILTKTGKSFSYYGFEPVKELFDKIRLNYGSNSSVQFYNFAIGNTNSIIPFYVSGGYKIEDGVIKDHYYGSSSIRKPKLVTEVWNQMTFYQDSVQSVSLDYFVQSKGLNDRIIDFIWADIQGAEIDLIRGGENTFQNVKYFYTEYSNSELYEGQVFLSDICNLLPEFEIVEDYKGDVLLKNKKYK
jgi:FkbM family methyltransferase